MDGTVTPQERAAQAYESHRDDIYKFLLIAGLSPDLAQESVQEAFLKLFSAYTKGEEIENPRAWAYRVAYNFAIKSMRPGWRFELLDPEAMPDGRSGSGSPEAELLERERMMQIRDAFAGLSPQQRQVVHLRAEGLRYREIADTLGVGVSTVGEFLARAMAKMRRALL